MIVGLEKFKDYFRDYAGNFIVIGGSACEMLFETEGMGFRKTKDIDIIITTLDGTDNDEFRRQFYRFVSDGSYEIYQKDDKYHYYRFKLPKEEGFPFMIELFSKSKFDAPGFPDAKYMPLDKDEDSHLSAIIMEEDLYNTVSENFVLIESIPVSSPLALIILKAFAWKDNKRRKENGEKVNSSDIKKHKNDIVRLHEILKDLDSITVSKEINEKIRDIINDIAGNITVADIKNVINRHVDSKEEFFREITSKFKKTE
ncbi:hypothetical protein KAU32_12580 [bacterium]|nr:hypothetical protein [bacterium]